MVAIQEAILVPRVGGEMYYEELDNVDTLCRRRNMSKLDEVWEAFTDTRTRFREAAQRVREMATAVVEHEVDLANIRRVLVEAKDAEVRAARNLRAAAAKVPGLLHAEVSGMCGGVEGATQHGDDASNATVAPT
jgi:hypothetical protein